MLVEAQTSTATAAHKSGPAAGANAGPDWEQVAAERRRLPNPSADDLLTTRLALNMIEAHRWRPELAQRLEEALPRVGRYRVFMLPSGQGSIAFVGGGRPVTLSPGGDPVAFLTGLAGQLPKLCPGGSTLQLSGAGDGYLLAYLASNPPALFLDTQQAVWVVEPEPEALLAVMALHDLTGPRGPLQQARFQFFVGDDWEAQMRHTRLTRPALSPAAVRLGLRPDAPSLGPACERIAAAAEEHDRETVRRIEAYYAQVDQREIARVLGREPGARPARVLLLTTRFSTVLQHSTRDAAAGIRQFGGDARIVIEEQPWERITPGLVRAALDAFKPDLVFQIDHLRSEQKAMFPPQVPFVCWIQDNLGNLMHPAAGSGIGPRDFVIGTWVERYVRQFGYPAASCLVVPRCTRVPEAPAVLDGSAPEAAPDLLYVSNHSDLPAQRLEQDAKTLGSHQFVDGFIEAGRRMIAIYEGGGCIESQPQVRDIVRACLPGMDASDIERLTMLLFERLNNTLYRQQGLAWAARAAADCGLRLEIRGNGWEKHPVFAALARGPVRYGPELESLTRSARFNLVLEPYFPTTHQRYLDAAVAGGLCVVRRSSSLPLLERWQEVVEALDERISTLDDARSLLGPEDLGPLLELHERLRPFYSWDAHDILASTRRKQRSDLAFTSQIPPGFARASFFTPEELSQRVRELSGDAPARAALAAEQQRFVTEHFSYMATMDRVLKWVGRRMDEQPLHLAPGNAA